MIKRFDYDDIRLHVSALDCKDAIQKAADILIGKGNITQQYVEEMMDVFQTYGPYFVLAPGMAFAHSKPSDSVKKTSLSMITLDEPVNFGSEKNDPVYLVCVIASQNNHDHLDMLKSIVTFLSDEHNVEAMKHAGTEEEKRRIIDSLNH